jgi:DNA-binding response OmpR family regulator
MAKKVFVIDDEIEFCNTIKNYLEDTKEFEVAMLTDPRQTLEAVKAFKPDVILLDLRMPHVGGFEVCQLLNNDEETKHVPLIIVTGFTDEGDAKKAFHMGASGYVTKPVNLKELREQIYDIVND